MSKQPTRRAVLAAAAALPALPAVAREGAFLEQVADGIWMHVGDTDVFTKANAGDIANVAVLETADGALIIDAGSTRAFGERLRSEVETRFGGLLATILTHHHPDHTFGTQALADRPIMALPKAAAKIEANKADYADLLYRTVGSAMGGTNPVMPNQSIGEGPITFGGRSLEILALAGHTSADLAVLDPATGTLIAGDLLFLERAPTVPDADIALWYESLDKLAAIGPSGWLPGHGPFDRKGTALRETRAYLDWLDARLTDAANRGLSAIEAMREPPPERWAALGANPEEYGRSVVQTFARYENEALPLLR
ncbi:MAG: quinoprotein relay system zinc metallohydrolase 1 [Pseudomonadota bacterium]